MRNFKTFLAVVGVTLSLCGGASAQVSGPIGPQPIPPQILLSLANTWSQTQTVSGASFGLTGNQSGSGIFGTSGWRYKNVAGTANDTTASGTIATNYDSVYGGNTLTATGTVTITKNYGSFFGAPICSTGVTCTNNAALGADSESIGGAALTTNALAVTGTSSFSGQVSSPTFNATNVSIGFQDGGYNQTGSLANSMFNLSGTLNTSGVVPGVFKMAITDTAHGAGSTIFNLLCGSAATTNCFSVALTGGVVTLDTVTYASCTALTTNASGVIGCTASDRRVKNDLGIVVQAAHDMPALHRFTFKTKGCGADGKTSCGPSGIHYGWFAQDVQKFYPELVHRGPKTPLTPDGELQFDKNELAVLLIAKEDAANDNLERRIAVLEKRLKR